MVESRPTPLVTRAEFDAFCQKGRLVGTPANCAAGILLKEHLERAGFVAIEGPRFALSRWSLAIATALLVAVAVFRKDPFMIFIFLFIAAFLFRVWRGIHAGAPGAVYGVRKDSGSAGASSPDTGGNKATADCGTYPTVVLCAHYDSASVPFPFCGSPLRTSLSLVAGMALVGLLTVLHPVVGILAKAALWGTILLAFLGRNASPGADDNASGVFTVLECLRRFGHLEGVNIIPVFFNFEEQGLFGSRAWVRRHVGRKGQGIPGVVIDPKKAYVINFDCVGRGRRIFISGNRYLSERLLGTASAQAFKASRTWLYPSDHLAFRAPWKAVSFVRANRFWALDLGWVHSKRDESAEVELDNIVEVSRIVEDFVRELATSAPVQSTIVEG